MSKAARKGVSIEGCMEREREKDRQDPEEGVTRKERNEVDSR